MVGRKRSANGHPLFVAGPADRLLLSRPDARDGPARRRHRHARGERAGLPRLHADRPRAGLRLEPHLGRQRHDRRVRGDALRERHPLPLQGPLPQHGHVRRRHPRGPAGELPHHRARPGDGLRDGRTAGAWRSPRSAPAAAATCSGSCSFQDLSHEPAAERPPVPAHRPRRRRSPSTWRTPTTATSRCSPPAGCRSARPAWTPACPPTAAAASSGAASSRRAGIRRSMNPQSGDAGQLEQQAGPRLPGGRRPVGLRLDLPLGHARGRARQAPAAHARVGGVGDEPGGHDRLPRGPCLAGRGRRCSARAV